MSAQLFLVPFGVVWTFGFYKYHQQYAKDGMDYFPELHGLLPHCRSGMFFKGHIAGQTDTHSDTDIYMEWPASQICRFSRLRQTPAAVTVKTCQAAHVTTHAEFQIQMLVETSPTGSSQGVSRI